MNYSWKQKSFKGAKTLGTVFAIFVKWDNLYNFPFALLHMDPLLKPGPELIKLFSCSTQLSMKFFMLINIKLLTMQNSFLLNLAEHENFSANNYENANYCWHFHIY